MIFSFTTNRKGVTLIELVLVIALIGITMSVAFSMFFFGTGTFSRGESQYDLQTEARFAMDSLIQDIRYAEEVRILDDHSSVEPYETALYYDFGTNEIVKTFGGSDTRYTLNSSAANPLLFKKTSDNSIQFILEGMDGGQNFALKSDILLLNVEGFKGTSLMEGDVVLFETPEAYRSKLLAPTVSLPDPNNNTSEFVEIVYNRPAAAFYAIDNSHIGVYPIDPLNINPLTASNINVSRTGFGLESILKVDIVISGVTLENGDIIELSIYDSTEVDNDGNPILQYEVIMTYNSTTSTWDFLN